MKRCQPYPEYKPSGIEWLGDVPEHWEIWKLAHLTTRIGSGKTPTGGADVYQNEGIVFLRSQNVYDDGLHLDDVVYIDKTIDEEMAWSRVKANDILLNITGASLGRTCITPKDMVKANVNQHVCVIRLKKEKNSYFISQYLKSSPAKAFYEFVQTGSAREGLNFEQIGAFPIPLPPLPEQQAIADYLDCETGKIDTLIEKKKQLIARLKEKRTALISRAVTKGLDPSVKLKPSGVDWLGDVPEHWEVKRLKHITSIKGRIGFRGYTTDDLVEVGEGALVLGGANLSKFGKLDLRKLTYLNWNKYYESPEIQVKKNDIVFGQRGTCGDPVLINLDLGPTTINPSLVLIKAGKYNSIFICYWLMSIYIDTMIRTLTSSTAVPMLSQEQIGNFAIFCPPLPEQQAIADYLDRETDKIDALIKKVETAVEKLREYRTALISAAVTGKIDVRKAAA